MIKWNLENSHYFSFYEIPWHNLVTVVFGFITILYVIIGVIMNYKK